MYSRTNSLILGSPVIQMCLTRAEQCGRILKLKVKLFLFCTWVWGHDYQIDARLVIFLEYHLFPVGQECLQCINHPSWFHVISKLTKVAFCPKLRSLMVTLKGTGPTTYPSLSILLLTGLQVDFLLLLTISVPSFQSISLEISLASSSPLCPWRCCWKQCGKACWSLDKLPLSSTPSSQFSDHRMLSGGSGMILPFVNSCQLHPNTF